jgi:hypothetical protein
MKKSYVNYFVELKKPNLPNLWKANRKILIRKILYQQKQYELVRQYYREARVLNNFLQRQHDLDKKKINALMFDGKRNFLNLPTKKELQRKHTDTEVVT